MAVYHRVLPESKFRSKGVCYAANVVAGPAERCTERSAKHGNVQVLVELISYLPLLHTVTHSCYFDGIA